MAYSPKVQELITGTELLWPPSFLAVVNSEAKMVAYFNLVLNDINIWPPGSDYSIDTMPNSWIEVVKFGSTLFAELFLQADATLQDFNWNDNGLSLNLDRVGKINMSYSNLLTAYAKMIKSVKVRELFRLSGEGIGSPKYTSSLGQFLKISLGGAWEWNY